MTTSSASLRPVTDPQALTDLCNAYAFAVDTKDLDGIGRCFTEDAVFDQRPTGVESVVRGREAIVEMFRDVYANTQARWHGVSNLRFHAIDDDHAVGTPYFTAVADVNGGGRLTYNGYWDDEYHRVDGVWMIAGRILRPLVDVERGGFDLAASS